MTATRAILNVPGVSCNHCKMAIEGAVGKLAGVQNVEVDVPAKSVNVAFLDDVVTLEAVESAVSEEGYEVVGRYVSEA